MLTEIIFAGVQIGIVLAYGLYDLRRRGSFRSWAFWHPRQERKRLTVRPFAGGTMIPAKWELSPSEKACLAKPVVEPCFDSLCD